MSQSQEEQTYTNSIRDMRMYDARELCGITTAAASTINVPAGTVSGFSLFASHRNEIVDVREEVDKMYLNILRSIEGEVDNDANKMRDSGRGSSNKGKYCAHNFAAASNISNNSFGDNSYGYKYNTTQHDNDNSCGRVLNSLHTPIVIDSTSDSRVAAMQSLLRRQSQGGSGGMSGSTCGLYRSNTFGSGRKGMSDPVRKSDDIPGPGAYFTEDQRRKVSTGRRAFSSGTSKDARPSTTPVQMPFTELGLPPRSGQVTSPPRPSSVTRIDSTQRRQSSTGPKPRSSSVGRSQTSSSPIPSTGVSFGRAERRSALSVVETINVSRESPVRPPGPGDYSIPSTFNERRPTSTRGSMGKAQRNAGDVKPFSPGPGSYAVETKATLPGAGASSAFASSSPRLPKTVTVAPGPGAYDTDLNKSIAAAAEKERKGYTFPKAPLPLLEEKEITPGPGEYDTELRVRDAAHAIRGGIPTAKRNDQIWGGKRLTEVTPGPGDYVTRLDEGKGVTMKFRYKEHVDERPGPGQYQATTVAESKNRNYPKWSFTGRPMEKTIEITPGPADYITIGETNGDAIGAAGVGISIAKASRGLSAEEQRGVDDVPGPGAYDVPVTTLTTVGAPKFGVSKRFDELDVAVRQAITVPGPGTYDATTEATMPKTPAVTISGPRDRFEHPHGYTATPGPGAYNPSEEKIKGSAVTIAVAQRNTDAAIGPAICGTDPNIGPGSYVNPISFNSGFAVSIGLPVHSNILEQYSDVGPGSYNVTGATAVTERSAPAVSINTTSRYAGVMVTENEVPGPGAYDTVNASTWLYERPPAAIISGGPAKDSMFEQEVRDKEHLGPGAYDPVLREPVVNMVIPCAKRFIDDEKIRREEELKPGPGAYDLGTTFDSRGGVTFTKEVAHVNDFATFVPGPGAYVVPSSTLVDKPFSFGVSAQRATETMLLNSDPNTPGPGAYETSTKAVYPHVSAPVMNSRPVECTEERGNINVGPGSYDPQEVDIAQRGVGFLKAPRIFDLAAGKEVPGPGWYTVNRQAIDSKTYEPFFSSANRRFIDETSFDVPGPGHYFVERAMGSDAISVVIHGNERKELYDIREAAKMPGPGTYDPFLPVSDAYVKINTTDRSLGDVSKEKASLPGPGAYTLPGGMNEKGGALMMRAPRNSLFEEADNGVPGPGRYDPYAAMQALFEASPAFSFTLAAKYGLVDNCAPYPGPGAYLPQLTPPSGAAFSFGKGIRSEVNRDTLNVPGPGMYDVHDPSLPNQPAFSMGQKREPNETRSEVPGPGAYNTELPRSGAAPSIGGGPARELHTHINNDVPGPGAYSTEADPFKENTPSYSMGKAQREVRDTKEFIPGPGAYDPKVYEEGRSISMAPKIPLKTAADYNIDVPGPGTYNYRDQYPFGGGEGAGPSPSFPKSVRFADADHKTFVPGPGSYLGIDKNGVVNSTGPAPSFGIGRRPELYSGDTTVPGPGMYDTRLQPGGPSISFPGAPTGRGGDLVNDSYPGPGQYRTEPRWDDARAVTFPGADRFPPQRNDAFPGPGQYSSGPGWNDGKGVSFPVSERLTDRALRDAVDIPGPGAYSMPMGKGGPSFTMSGRVEKLPAGNDYPGPGAYDVDNYNEPHSPVAFLGGSARPDTTVRDGPGPGAYRLPGMLSPLGAVMPVASRMPHGPNEDYPGPGMYDPHSDMFDGPAYTFPSAPKGGREDNDVPGPGMYNTYIPTNEPAYTFSHAPREDRERDWGVGPGEYNAGPTPYGGPAFSFPTAIVRPVGDDAMGPGPGEYRTDAQWGDHGYTMGGKWQEPSPKDVMPGPGHYRVHDYDPYARDRATIIDFSKGGERIIYPVTTTTTATVGVSGFSKYYPIDPWNQGWQKNGKILQCGAVKYVEVSPGPPDYHNPNVVNPFYDPLSH